MTEPAYLQVWENSANRYATREDFCRIFAEHLDELYQLAFLLTRAPVKAERCLVASIEDCATGSPVFRPWARSWAKRNIIKNAIRELKPRPGHSYLSSPRTSSHVGQPLNGSSQCFQIAAVLELVDFERFVFAMCVLENYSQHDCALLLECSLSAIREASARAFAGLVDASRRFLSLNQAFMKNKVERTHSANRFSPADEPLVGKQL
jgi:DNA-directed RNA polymerase specialized sigma24 family protein